MRAIDDNSTSSIDSLLVFSILAEVMKIMEDKPNQIKDLQQKYTDWAVRFATAKTDEEGRHLLELLGMPFTRD